MACRPATSSRSGGIGRRAWFRSMYPQGCGGSSPFFGTNPLALSDLPPWCPPGAHDTAAICANFCKTENHAHVDCPSKTWGTPEKTVGWLGGPKGAGVSNKPFQLLKLAQTRVITGENRGHDED